MKKQSGLIVAMLAPAISFAAGAQEGSIIDEIIVTAQKRETALQDVPFSVAAASEQQIRSSGATNVVDLARNFASLAIADLGPGQSQVAIRGISAGQVIRDQPGVKEQVGIYLDESPISIALFTPDLDFFDLARFEVLRGPQGTLFGAGSLSGTLRYITAQPKLGEFGGAVELSALDGSDTSFGGAVKGAINLPLGEIAALRIVGYYNELPGFIDVKGLDDQVVDDDVDTGSKTGGRIALTIQPNENISITPRIVYQKLDTDGFPRIDDFNILANPYTTTQPRVNIGDRQQYIQLEEGLEDEFTLADLKLEFGFGNVALTSVSSYTDRKVVVTRDATTLTGSVSFDIEFPDIVRLSSALVDTTDLKAFSQELRLASTSAGPFDWLVGAFYQDVDRDYSQYLPTPGWDAATGTDNASLNAVTDSPFFSGLDYKFKQLALFGEATWHFSDQWALTGGVRYYDFDEDRILNFGGAFADVTEDLPGSTSSDGFSPRAILAFNPTDDVQLTAQVSRGFRLGGINDPINLPLCSPEDVLIFGNQQTFDDETVWNYELGAKMQFADRRVTFNVAAFYSDIEDLQATTDAGTCSSRIVFNVPKARSIGVEAELFARPSDNWDFGVAATWVNAELKSTVSSTSGGETVVVGGLEDGKRLPTAPEFQAVASLGYSVDFSNDLRGFANLTLQYVGSSFSQFADNTANFGVIATDQAAFPGSARLIPYGDPDVSTITFASELPSYDLGNLRFGVRKDQWELAAFVNNLWDERAYLALDRERGRSARVGYLTNMPRTYGLSLRLDF
ncbi:TonB-dependent receptor [Povalibacter sp.]|uniref:TonB-dependent receptor n=1 Tax=Povalibacter sp. TaxID=1962978 RepID=UPI002F40B2CE